MKLTTVEPQFSNLIRSKKYVVNWLFVNWSKLSHKKSINPFHIHKNINKIYFIQNIVLHKEDK